VSGASLRRRTLEQKIATFVAIFCSNLFPKHLLRKRVSS